MENDLFKLKAVGLDTTNLNYLSPLEKGDYKYVHINFGSNNEEFITEVIKDAKIFMTVDFVDNLQTAIGYYTRLNGINSLEGLLIDSKCDFNKYSDQIKGLIDSGFITESALGISQPESVDQLEKINKIFEFRYISLNICPLCFNVDIINWAKENDKIILGFNPFGGFLSYPNIIESFTVPYLLGFIATYADFVFLSSRDLVYSANEKNYLESLIGCTSEKLYLFTKSLNKLVQPIQKAIKNYLIVDENIVIEVEDPVFSLNKNEVVITIMTGSVEQIPEPEIAELSNDGTIHYDVDTLSPEKFINTHFIMDLKDNKPADISDESYLSLLKYQIMELLENYYNEKYKDLYGSCEVTIGKLCKNSVLFSVDVIYIEKTGIFTVDKRAEKAGFILYYRDGKFLFQKVSAKD